jgi:hypothetical protein
MAKFRWLWLLFLIVVAMLGMLLVVGVAKGANEQECTTISSPMIGEQTTIGCVKYVRGYARPGQRYCSCYNWWSSYRCGRAYWSTGIMMKQYIMYPVSWREFCSCGR